MFGIVQNKWRDALIVLDLTKLKTSRINIIAIKRAFCNLRWSLVEHSF